MTILSSFAIGFALLFTLIRKPEGGFIALLLKALASLMLVFISVKLLNLAPDAYVGLPALFLLAMFFSLAGDVFIELKATFPSKSFGFLFLGFLSFLAAQVFLISAFISLSDIYYSIFFYGILASAVLHFVFIKFLKYKMQGFVLISVIYTGFLLSVLIQTGVYAYSLNWQTLPMVFFLAALLFALSNAILSQTLFANKNKRPYIIAVHLSYYGAQILYLWTLYFYLLTIES